MGNDLQGSRSGGLITWFLTRLGIVGIQVSGQFKERQVLNEAADGKVGIPEILLTQSRQRFANGPSDNDRCEGA